MAQGNIALCFRGYSHAMQTWPFLGEAAAKQIPLPSIVPMQAHALRSGWNTSSSNPMKMLVDDPSWGLWAWVDAH